MTKTTILDSKTFGYWANLAIQKYFQKIIKHEADVIKDKDPEALHQMRVGMRRLRTAVTSLAPALDLPKAAQEKKIAAVARQLGQLRDLDVLQDVLQNYYLPTLPHSEQKIIKKVLTTVGKQRQQSLEQVQTTIKQQRYQKLKLAFQDWLAIPTYRELAQISIEDVLPELLLPSVSKLFLDSAWLIGVKLAAGEVEVPSPLNGEIVAHLLNNHGDSLHRLRKQAKRVRYQMELFTDFYCFQYQEYLKDIKAIQSILGRIQDSVVLAAFLTDTIKSEMAVKLPTLATQLMTHRYQAWQEWRIIQQQYLHFSTRRDFYQEILQTVATPVQ
ncbi:MAG: CHAD domain-containing protein [Symploca sp. SIO1C4]|uniref:CHAD domain-containing protein n=1 Tax=Symploca sp. SIO1C4 TaxID=2607765 RepID=A0A6B3NHX1_9CYAN|nr:CHAD domain-containing protein [Symploca sp. SIO1C4]